MRVKVFHYSCNITQQFIFISIYSDIKLLTSWQGYWWLKNVMSDSRDEQIW